MTEDRDLEDCLDGLMDAVYYLEDEGHDDLSMRVNRIYQEVGDRVLSDDGKEASEE